MDVNQMQFPGIYIFALSECMTDFGIDKAIWLQGSGLDKIDASFAESKISYELFRNLFIRAIELSNNPAVGILVGQRLSLQSHGMLGYALMNCENLLAALKLVGSYLSLRMPLLQVRSEEIDDELVLYLEEKAPLDEVVRVVLFDAVLVTIKAAIEQLQPNLKKELTLGFPYAKHKNFPYGNIKDCTLKFNEDYAGIRFNNDILYKPIPLANIAAYKEAELVCAQELEPLGHKTTYSGRIKQKLIENSEHFPTQTVMSSYFNMTSRTLHRRLIDEGTSYREILDEVKHSLALSYLSKQQMSIKEVAYFLGYGDERNFRRAFKRWQGTSPSEYRLKMDSNLK